MPKKVQKKVQVTRAALIGVAKDLNDSLHLDPKIKTGSKITLGQLTDDISGVVDELEEGDVLNQSTIAVLEAMDVDIPVKVKIRGQRKVKNEEYHIFLATLIEKGKYTRKQIMEMATNKYPDTKKQVFITLLSNGKNPKYNRFASLIVQDENKVMSFEKK